MRTISLKGRNLPTFYVPVTERHLPFEEQLRIRTRRLDALERGELQDKAVDVSVDGELLGIKTVSFTYHGAIAVLDGWENFKDEATGKDIPFDRSNRREMFDLLPEDIQDELARVFGSGAKNERVEETLVEAQEKRLSAAKAVKEVLEAEDTPEVEAAPEAEAAQD